MTDELHADLVVLGAGPAGGHAALAASGAGLDVVLIDEGTAPGGQVWRAPGPGLAVTVPAALGPDHRAGEALRRALAASTVRIMNVHRAWLLQPGFVVHAAGPDGDTRVHARALLLAPGTSERVIPFAGWTLPGVIGLAGATALLKGNRMLPGHDVVVAGAGPLLLAVAAAILKGGGKVAAVVDLAATTDWLRAVPAMRGRPDLLLRGLGWRALLHRHRVPYLARHAVLHAEGTDAVTAVTVAPVDRDGRFTPGATPRRFAADALAIGHGLVPATEAARLLGARHRHVPALGGWVPELDPLGRSSVAGLSIAGDGAGVRGAASAALAGTRAGLAVAHDLGRLDAVRHAAMQRPLATQAARADRFGGAMAALMQLRPGLVKAIPSEIVICRCEDVTRQEIEAAFDEGARQIGQLKAWTRCGMGPCQGRICGPTIEALAARRGIAPEDFGPMVARPPLRPTTIHTLTGDFDPAALILPPSLPSG